MVRYNTFSGNNGGINTVDDYQLVILIFVPKWILNCS